MVIGIWYRVYGIWPMVYDMLEYEYQDLNMVQNIWHEDV